MGTKNFSNYSDMITFSRASSGTALAKISYGPELVTNGTFDTDTTGWTPSSGATLTAISGQLDVSQTTTDFVWGYQAVTCQIGKVYVVTVDIINSGGQFRVGSASNGLDVTYFGGTGSYSYVFVAPSTQVYLSAKNNYTGDNTSSQFDNISVREVLFDQPDGTLQLFNHPANQPRVEYDAQGNRLGLLVEEARTNLSTNSLSFSPFQGIAAVASTEVAPDNSTDATLVTASGNGAHRVRAGLSTTVTSTGVAYAISVFVKNVDANYVQILDGGDGTYFATFDLVNETVGSTGNRTTGTITKYPDGWYRLSAMYDGAGTMGANTAYIYIAPSASATYGQGANNPGAQMHLWGFQTEAGTFPTSYIPTSGATATRSADVASIGVGAFGYNAQGGTVVVTADWYPGSNFLVSNRAALEIGDGGVSERLLIYNHDGFAGRGFMKGVLFGDQTGSGARITDDQAKVALVFADANQAHCVDGGSIDTGSAAMLAGTTIMKIGPTLRTGHISSIAYYPRRLTDAQIKALTSPPETPTLSLTFDDSSTSYLETSIHG